MGGYLSSRKLGNVKGRMKYVTDEGRQENIVDYYNTTNNEFWSMLAKESRQRHKESKAKGKCCEARELIIGIPQNSNITAKEICDTFKNKYKAECSCAIHHNKKKEIENKHCHLIFSEREKLESPETIEEKRALRTYYYDDKGHKCKKAEATKVVKKGTILQKATTRYFSDKNEYFKSQKFVYECKEMFLKDLLKIDWSLAQEKQNKELSERHVGVNNPKAEYIKQNNELKAKLKNICNASDFIINKEKGFTLKNFKSAYEIQDFSAINYDENKRKVKFLEKEVQSIFKDTVRNEVRKHNSINQDVNLLEEDEVSLSNIQDGIIYYYEEETKTKEKPKVIEFLKNKLSNMIERLCKLVSMQDSIYIEPKNQIEIEQDTRTNELQIIDSDYVREEKAFERDCDLEL